MALPTTCHQCHSERVFLQEGHISKYTVKERLLDVNLLVNHSRNHTQSTNVDHLFLKLIVWMIKKNNLKI